MKKRQRKKNAKKIREHFINFIKIMYVIHKMRMIAYGMAERKRCMSIPKENCSVIPQDGIREVVVPVNKYLPIFLNADKLTGGIININVAKRGEAEKWI